MSNSGHDDSAATAPEPPALTPATVQNAYDFAAFLLDALWLFRTACLRPEAADPVGAICYFTDLLPQIQYFAVTVKAIEPLLPLHQTWLGNMVEANSISLVLRLFRETAAAITETGRDFPPDPTGNFSPEFVSALPPQILAVMPAFPSALPDTLRLENKQALQALQVAALAAGAPAQAVSSEPAAVEAAEPSAVAFQQRVGLMEMAAIVHRKKRTLERYKRKLPAPAVKGGKGKPDEWLWDDVRPVLEQEFGMKLPEHFPASRFLQR